MSLGGDKTKDNITKVNTYFKDNTLFQQAKALYSELNDKNISMIIRRLNKDWSNYFQATTDYFNGNPQNLLGKPSYPQAKKLSKVFNYSVPLVPSIFKKDIAFCAKIFVRYSKDIWAKFIDEKMFNNRQFIVNVFSLISNTNFKDNNKLFTLCLSCSY